MELRGLHTESTVMIDTWNGGVYEQQWVKGGVGADKGAPGQQLGPADKKKVPGITVVFKKEIMPHHPAGPGGTRCMPTVSNSLTHTTPTHPAVLSLHTIL
eukprot:2540154-Pyramimonas_sp.AAC.2